MVYPLIRLGWGRWRRGRTCCQGIGCRWLSRLCNGGGGWLGFRLLFEKLAFEILDNRLLFRIVDLLAFKYFVGSH